MGHFPADLPTTQANEHPTLPPAFEVAALKGLAFLVCCLAVPIGLRIWLDHDLETPRDLVDGDTPLSNQKWELVLWYQLPFVLPFLALAVARWRRLPTLVRWLWLYLPVLVLAYLSRDYILHEVRSFWALVPVVTRRPS